MRDPKTQPPQHRTESWSVLSESADQRIDVFLAHRCNGYSRVFLRDVIKEGKVRVDGRPVKPSFKVQPGQRVDVELPPPPDDGPIPEAIPLRILYEDDGFVVIDKPANMVVHPAKGHWQGTLTSALAHHFQELSDVGGPSRPGIVHRLDRETSGVIVIAKTNAMHFQLAAKFEARDVTKEYHAIVVGQPSLDRDWIRAPIGHHPYQREKMAIRAGHSSSREAETQYEVLERYQGFSYVRVLPKTGRTHQIRVHFAHIGFPILCDRLYAGHSRVTRGQLLRRQALRQPPQPGDDDVVLERQALHAYQLSFRHPLSDQPLTFTAELPHDFRSCLDLLRRQAT